MKIRLIQLINNYYRDESQEGPEPEKALGEFCCLGYFDAMHQKEIRWDPAMSKEGIRESVKKIELEKLDGKSNRRSFVCINEKDEEDRQFWDHAEDFPYVFVTILRVNNKNRGTGLRIREKISRLVGHIRAVYPENVAVYYTYDRADLVIVKSAGSYREGMEFVCEVREHEDVYKMYSVFAVWEKVLERCVEEKDYPGIADEDISCRLRGSVKDMGKAVKFAEALESRLGENAGGGKKAYSVEQYHILGKNDLIMELNQIPIRALLPCYLMGEILSHAANAYKDAFFNIESEILIKSEKSKCKSG